MATITEETTKPAASAKGGVKVTDKALAKVRTAIVKEGISPEQGGLRLGVQGGGCSGLSYNIRFDTQPRERDRIFQFGDVRVFVDPKSFIYLNGMVLDYPGISDAAGICVRQSQCLEVMRLRNVVLRVKLVWRGRPRPRAWSGKALRAPVEFPIRRSSESFYGICAGRGRGCPRHMTK